MPEISVGFRSGLSICYEDKSQILLNLMGKQQWDSNTQTRVVHTHTHSLNKQPVYLARHAFKNHTKCYIISFALRPLPSPQVCFQSFLIQSCVPPPQIIMNGSRFHNHTVWVRQSGRYSKNSIHQTAL